MSRTRWALFALGLFLVEVWIATRGRHLPFVRADLGDYLVVTLVYAVAKAVRPLRPAPLAVAVFALGCAVDLEQALGLADWLGLGWSAELKINYLPEQPRLPAALDALLPLSSMSRWRR